MAITLDDPGGFVGTTQLTTKPGLYCTNDSNSSAELHGTGLVDGLEVVVLRPPKSQSPKHRWKGTTTGSSSDHTQCKVINLKKEVGDCDHDRDSDVMVSVTATDTSTGQTSNTITPMVTVGP